MRVVSITFALVVACGGRVGEANRAGEATPTPTASATTSPPTEATKRTCTSGAFGAPTLVGNPKPPANPPSANPSSITNARFFAGEEWERALVSYADGREVRQSTFPFADAPFTLTVLFDHNGKLGAGVAPTSDGKAIVYTKNKELRRATRETEHVAFRDVGAVTVDGGVATSFEHPYMFKEPDLLVSKRAPSGLYDVARLSWSGTTYTASVLSGLDTTADESHPVARDESTIWFASDRDGSLGLDVWVAERTGSAYTARRVVELSSGGAEWPTFVSENGCDLFLVSDRTGDPALYRASR